MRAAAARARAPRCCSQAGDHAPADRTPGQARPRPRSACPARAAAPGCGRNYRLCLARRRCAAAPGSARCVRPSRRALAGLLPGSARCHRSARRRRAAPDPGPARNHRAASGHPARVVAVPAHGRTRRSWLGRRTQAAAAAGRQPCSVVALGQGRRQGASRYARDLASPGRVRGRLHRSGGHNPPRHPEGYVSSRRRGAAGPCRLEFQTSRSQAGCGRAG